jgi:hypothetical protein
MDSIAGYEQVSKYKSRFQGFKVSRFQSFKVSRLKGRSKGKDKVNSLTLRQNRAEGQCIRTSGLHTWIRDMIWGSEAAYVQQLWLEPSSWKKALRLAVAMVQPGHAHVRESPPPLLSESSVHAARGWQVAG